MTHGLGIIDYAKLSEPSDIYRQLVDLTLTGVDEYERQQHRMDWLFTFDPDAANSAAGLFAKIIQYRQRTYQTQPWPSYTPERYCGTALDVLTRYPGLNSTNADSFWSIFDTGVRYLKKNEIVRKIFEHKAEVARNGEGDDSATAAVGAFVERYAKRKKRHELWLLSSMWGVIEHAQGSQENAALADYLVRVALTTADEDVVQNCLIALAKTGLPQFEAAYGREEAKFLHNPGAYPYVEKASIVVTLFDLALEYFRDVDRACVIWTKTDYPVCHFLSSMYEHALVTGDTTVAGYGAIIAASKLSPTKYREEIPFGWNLALRNLSYRDNQQAIDYPVNEDMRTMFKKSEPVFDLGRNCALYSIPIVRHISRRAHSYIEKAKKTQAKSRTFDEADETRVFGYFSPTVEVLLECMLRLKTDPRLTCCRVSRARKTALEAQ